MTPRNADPDRDAEPGITGRNLRVRRLKRDQLSRLRWLRRSVAHAAKRDIPLCESHPTAAGSSELHGTQSSHSGPVEATHQPQARQSHDLELPSRSVPQQCVKPRKSNVSGLPCPRLRRLSTAKRPNSISRVLSGCRASPNFASHSRKSSRKACAVRTFSKPATFRTNHNDLSPPWLFPPVLNPEIEGVAEGDGRSGEPGHESVACGSVRAPDCRLEAAAGCRGGEAAG